MLKKIIINELVKAGYALAVTVAIGRWAIYYAYLKRGYEAVGGEYILILVIYVLAYKAIHCLFNAFSEGEKNAAKKKRGNAIRTQYHR